VLGQRVGAAFSPYQPAEEEPEAIDAGARQGRNFAPERARPDGNPFDSLRDHVGDLHADGRRVAIASYSGGSRDRLAVVLREHGIADLAPVQSWPEVAELSPRAVALVLLGLERGFETAELALISEQDLLGERLARPPRKRSRRAENFIAQATDLNTGDLVVHVDHGIGRYEGLQTIDVAGAPHDCVWLIYDGGDRLFVPVENIEVLSRYGSGDAEVALDKLGGVGWQSRKARLKKRVREIADQLIAVAAARTMRRADKLTPPEGMYQEFCARFPFAETDDQERSIGDVLNDLSSGHPMDRLVCGDVGFGKTEVALRSAFVAVMDGKQVAVVTPTTLLCRQHFNTFSQRFAELPVRIEQLSRLVSPKQAAEVRADLARGTVDIVIGTHALLAKRIAFKDLGLLVIDEEQHFGVTHKERLKQLRTDVHVLTLTATPIPRTLQMALSGVREMSLIATPPVDRLAIRTFVMPFDPVVVREAILREHYRGGQTFYVCPRIVDLAEVGRTLQKLVPEVKIAVAHGRLPAAELDKVMNAFYDGAYDVLLSTSIIDSGLDIPTANTMIIHRADMFGLAQLYQLRGRIGRSKLRAYAYLTLPPRRVPTAGAEKRLQAMQALDSLGAGFNLASHDLDIRGAGNLLGEEQSGHVREVGIELYQHMLEEAVVAARGGQTAEGVELEDRWSPQITLGTAVLIPESYIADLGVRIDLYRRIAALEERSEIDAFAAEMIDRFGPLPDEVEHLLEVVVIKSYCRQAGAAKLDAGPRGATLAFRDNRFANPAGLVEFITRQGASARLRPDHTLLYLRDWSETQSRLEGVRHLMRNLAEIAVQASADSVSLAAAASESP
jgi:transcription-repair coupling factor (superfamily II helicase)